MSSGEDELVKLYALDERREKGVLAKHDASVTAVDCTEPAAGIFNAVTGDSSGAIFVWRQKRWDCVGSLAGHSGPVVALAFHPTGLALVSASVERKKRGRLILWDPVKGIKKVTEELAAPPLDVKWNARGTVYLVLYADKVVCRHALADGLFGEYAGAGGGFSAGGAGAEGENTPAAADAAGLKSRNTCATFLGERNLVIGKQDGSLVFIKINKDFSEASRVVSKLGKSRVKGVRGLTADEFVSVDSEGVLRVFRMHEARFELLHARDTNCRPTCLTVVEGA